MLGEPDAVGAVGTDPAAMPVDGTPAVVVWLPPTVDAPVGLPVIGVWAVEPTAVGAPTGPEVPVAAPLVVGPRPTPDVG